MDFLRDIKNSRIIVLDAKNNPLVFEKSTMVRVYMKQHEPAKHLLLDGAVKCVLQEHGIIVVTAWMGFDYRLRFGASNNVYEGHPVPLVTSVHRGKTGNADVVIAVASISIEPQFEEVKESEKEE